MKSLKLTIGTLMVAVLALAACGKKSSGTSTPAYGLDAYGNPVGGGSGYVGRGSFQGTLTVTDPNLYRQMLYTNQMCTGIDGCAYVSNLMGLALTIDSDWLPGPGTLTIRTNGYTYGGNTVLARAYAIGSNGYSQASGFQLVYSQYPTMTDPMVYPQQQISQQTVSAIQVISTFDPNNRSIVNTEVRFQGRQVAVGVLQGQLFGGGYCYSMFGCMQGGISSYY